MHRNPNANAKRNRSTKDEDGMSDGHPDDNDDDTSDDEDAAVVGADAHGVSAFMHGRRQRQQPSVYDLLAIDGLDDIKATKGTQACASSFTKQPFFRSVSESVYTTSDGQSVALCGQDESSCSPALAEAFGIPGGEVTRGAVDAAVAQLTCDEVEAKLTAAGVVFVKQKSLTDVASLGSKDDELSSCFVPIHGIDDLDELPAIPYDFSCCSERGKPRFPAGQIGSCTAAFSEQGWSPRHTKAELPRAAAEATTAAAAPTCMLDDVIVFELSRPVKRAVT